MQTFDPEVPVGFRSSCDYAKRKGDVLNRWLDNDVPEHYAENMRLHTGDIHPALTKAQHKDALGVLARLKGQAARGQLEIGVESKSAAKIIKRVGYIIELRPRMSRGTVPPRLFRLYFAEPARRARSLLPLKLDTKPSDGDPNGEQNASIDEAAARSDRWQRDKTQP